MLKMSCNNFIEALILSCQLLMSSHEKIVTPYLNNVNNNNKEGWWKKSIIIERITPITLLSLSYIFYIISKKIILLKLAKQKSKVLFLFLYY